MSGVSRNSRFAAILICLSILTLASCSTMDVVNAVAGAMREVGPQDYTFHGEAIRGQVLEYGIGLPIHGASVTVRWQVGTTYGAVEGRQHGLAYIHMAEAVTDADGRFALPAWGPVRYSIPDDDYRMFFTGDWLGGKGVSGPSGKLKFLKEACILLYLPGYDPAEYCNPASDRQVLSGMQASIWSNRDLRLRKTPDNYKSQRSAMIWATALVTELAIHSAAIVDGKPFCGWRRMPNLIRYALQEERRIYAVQPKSPSIRYLAEDLGAGGEGDKKRVCGPIEPFLKSLTGVPAK